MFPLNNTKPQIWSKTCRTSFTTIRHVTVALSFIRQLLHFIIYYSLKNLHIKPMILKKCGFLIHHLHASFPVVWAVRIMFCGVEFILPKVHTLVVDSSSRPHQGRCYSHNTTSLIFRIVRPKKWSQSVCIIVRTTFKHFVFALYIIWQFLPWRKIHLLFGTCMLSPIFFFLIILWIIRSWVLSIIRLKRA